MSRIYDALKDAEHKRSAVEPAALPRPPAPPESSGLIGALKGKLFSTPRESATGLGPSTKAADSSAAPTTIDSEAGNAAATGGVTEPATAENLLGSERADRDGRPKSVAPPAEDAVSVELNAARQNVASVEAAFARLADRLAAAAREIKEKGTAPSEEFISELSLCRCSFEDVSAAVGRLARSLSVPGAHTASAPATVDDLRTMFDVVTFHDTRRRAVAVLDRVLSIAPTAGVPFPPLVECQERARQLLAGVSAAEWPAQHSESEALASAEHPFAKLVTLVERGAGLSDDEWLTLHDEVTSAFGKPLSVAVTRNHLQIPVRGRVAPPPPREPSGASEVVPEKRTSQCRNCGAELESGAMFCGECGSPVA